MKNLTFLSKRICSVVFVFLTVLIALPLSVFSEVEPNNSIETANQLSLGGNISGSFSAADNSYDYFKIVTTADGKLTVKVASDAGLCVALYFLNETGFYVLYNNGTCGAGNYSSTITIENLAEGTYYIQAGNAGYGNYTIGNTFVAAALTNDLENNDKLESALVLSPNSEKTGHLGFRKLDFDYYDCYKITTTTDGKLSISFTTDPTLCIDLTVMNETGFYSLYNNGTCGAGNYSSTITIENLAKGTYYLWTSAVGYGSYRISNTFVAAGLANDTEPNNSIATATVLTLNNSLAGHLGYKNIQTDDYDYYKIVTPNNGNLGISVNADPSLCVDLTLLNNTGLSLLFNGSCGNSNHSNTMTKTGLETGTYYVQASGVGYGSYTIFNTFSNITGVGEILNPEETEFCVFPNPAHSELFISGRKWVNANLSIHDVSGKMVYSEIINSNVEDHWIDISGLRTGIYFVEMIMNKISYREKFIKE